MHGNSSSSQHAQSTAHLSLTARSQPPIRQHMSPALSESRTPSDIMRLHKTAFNRINGNDRSRTRVSTTKLKHMFVNNREREELMSACSIGDVDKVNHILTYTKPNVNPDLVRDSKLRTPLLVACAGGKADVVRLLIRWGADVNNPMGDIIGNKPLDLAVISSNVDTVLAVLEAGAKVMRPGLSSSSDDPLPGSLRQRQTRSPLRLAESRLDLLIAKRQEQGSSMLEEGKQDKNMDQIIQIIKLLKYFSPSSNNPSDKATDTVANELDELTSKLSSIALNSTTDKPADDLEIMMGLREVITKLHI
ncbi:hypothetical protein K492DRAFT_157544 [Lichtheimia hyalospora FSU 10163]|nr:hypothetical protein K492DRAFT_157544 [Lichtheimia hyalospora FSU 10163]